jgi:predicted permease
LPIFGRVLLPIALVALAGSLLDRFMRLDRQSVGRVVFYLFTPALIFRGLYQIDMAYSIVGRTALIAASVTITTGVLAWLLGTGMDRRQRAAITLTSGLSNNGNMGLPISLFAFGEAGLALATVYYVTNSFLGNTLGTFVASTGQASPMEALRRTLQVPLFYAAIGGLSLGVMDVTLPLGLMRFVDIMADAAVPTMLVLLGMQLNTVPFTQRQASLSIAMTLRLLLAPLLATGLVWLMGTEGLERSVVILQAGMPTAVIATVLATEYDAAPRLVAATVVFTTLASMITLSILLWTLQV